jgi:hypothetical protein
VRLLRRALAATALTAAAGCASTPSLETAASRADGCDRVCLEDHVDRYFAALSADDPGAAPLAEDVRFTEDGQRLSVGDGLWNTMREAGGYRLVVADAAAGQIAVITTVVEGNANPTIRSPAAIALRLKVRDGFITEIEQFLAREPATAARIESLGSPRAALTSPVPAAERMSRADLIDTANTYFTGMQNNDGLGDYPFSERCDRLENANRATNAPTPPGETRPDPRSAPSYSAQWTCREQFESGLLNSVTRIRDRRFVAVDEERGLVAAFAFFDHEAGQRQPYVTRWGVEYRSNLSEPWTWEILEIFKIEDGLIAEIEALLIRSPYGMPSGWSAWDDAMSDRAHDATGYTERP